MEKKISKLRGHYVICGFGRMGKIIADNLAVLKKSFVVIENDDDKIAKLEDRGYLFIKGDATFDEVLISANIDKAKGVVCVLSNDADNLFTTVTARALNPEIFILTRSIFSRTETKLKKAGANRVINPYEISGHKMTRVLLTPFVDDFIEIVSKKRKIDLGIEEIQVYSSSEIAGKALKDTNIRSRFNVIVTAVIDKSGDMDFNPSPDRIIEANETLIALGKSNDLTGLRKVCKGNSR